MDSAEIFFQVSRGEAPSHRPPVVLVHGYGMSSRYMVPLALELAPDFRVYAPDLPGFGRSSKPRKVLDMVELADALAGWMARIGLRRAVMIGNSMGCQVLVEFAVRHEDWVDRLVLQGLTPDPAARTVFASRSGDSWSTVVTKDRGRSRASYCAITPPPARADYS